VKEKPRLRIFANQEAEELKKESDFISPQPFIGKESKFEGLHYPDDTSRVPIQGLVELAMNIDADGNLKELEIVSENPPLIGFRRAAAEDFRVAKFIPAFSRWETNRVPHYTTGLLSTGVKALRSISHGG
jgi:hypothetical protein